MTQTPLPPPPSLPYAGWSLQQRLRRHLLVALLVLWVISAVASVLWQRHELDEVLDSALIETAQRILTLPPNSDPIEPPSHSETVQLQRLNEKGNVVWRSREAPATAMATLPLNNRTATEGPWRIAVQVSQDGTRTAIAAENLEERREAMWSAAKSFLMPLILLMPLSAALVSWILRQGFATLDPLRHALATLNAGQLHLLPDSPLPQELQPLVITINDLLARINQLRAAERSFAANSAHELRTPLAAARAQAQRLLADNSSIADRARVQALIRQLDHLHTLTAKLLQLARIDSGIALSQVPLDLNTLATLIADEFRGQHSRLSCHRTAAPVEVRADIDALGMATRNLVENAFHHAGPQAHVVIEVHANGTLEVWDDGPGVKAETLATLKHPFERGSTRSPGHGLGLSIAEAIAQQSGGHLILQSPHTHGPGFSASLQIPLISASPATDQ